MTTMILDKKGIQYEYRLYDSFNAEEQNRYMNMASHVGQMSFPLIIKEDKVITLQEV